MHVLYDAIVLLGALCSIFLTSLVVGGWLLDQARSRYAYRQYQSRTVNMDEDR